MKRVFSGAMTIGAMVVTAALVSAQEPPAGAARGQAQGQEQGQRQGGRGGAPAQPLKNLQVFPKETTQAQILPVMRAFEGALQVECGHCHVWEGPGNPANDFASDAKPQKNIARAMMRMTAQANEAITAGVAQTGLRTAEQVQKVTCATCHRGSALPQVPTYNPPAPARGAGSGSGAPAGTSGTGAPPGGGR